MRYHKKQTETIDAEYFDGTRSEADRLKRWIGPQTRIFSLCVEDEDALCILEIPSTGVTLRAENGCWITKGSDGRFGVLDTEAFTNLYEPSQLA